MTIKELIEMYNDVNKRMKPRFIATDKLNEATRC